MGQLHSGIHPQLEDAATELLRKSLEGVTSMSEKSDILTPWKEMDRRRREVYMAEGVPDAALRRGMYHRAWNSQFPHLNSTDGKVPVPADLLGGSAEPRYDRDASVVRAGEVYDLRVFWGPGPQYRVKCPGCSKYVREALEIVCKCGSIFSQKPEAGHYQVVRIIQ
jgi:hypothetical protein